MTSTTSEREQMLSRDDRQTTQTDPVLAAVARVVRRAGLTGPQRAAVWEAVGTARDKSTHGDAMTAARILYATAGEPETPGEVAEVLRRVAPHFIEGGRS